MNRASGIPSMGTKQPTTAVTAIAGTSRYGGTSAQAPRGTGRPKAEPRPRCHHLR